MKQSSKLLKNKTLDNYKNPPLKVRIVEGENTVIYITRKQKIKGSTKYVESIYIEFGDSIIQKLTLHTKKKEIVNISYLAGTHIVDFADFSPEGILILDKVSSDKILGTLQLEMINKVGYDFADTTRTLNISFKVKTTKEESDN